jgi:integrase/recombinase XerD
MARLEQRGFVMLEHYAGPKARERARRCWLRPLIDGFLRHLTEQRYSHGTLRLHALQLLAFAEYTAGQGVSSLEQLPDWVGPFAAQLRLSPPSLRKWQQLITRFIRHLQQNKIITAPTPPPLSPQAALVEDYLQFLRYQRGLADRSLQGIQHHCNTLLTFLAAQGVSDLRALRAEVIHRFIAWRGEQCQRLFLSATCSALRGFLPFLYQRGIVPLDLTPAVVSPRVYRHEQCPRFLTGAEVRSVLAAIRRDTPLGRRDAAMVLLLAVYGLRGIEVVRLRLDDFDWHRQLLHVRHRKAGNNTTYPLSVPVGEAVLAYLRDGRPTSTLREVFLSVKAPFVPLAYSSGLAYRVKHYLALAGIHVARPGTHSFRYSCAQRLFEQGMPMKTVGDYLGHRDPMTTQRYTKIALEQLRGVATGDGEDVL